MRIADPTCRFAERNGERSKEEAQICMHAESQITKVIAHTELFSFAVCVVARQTAGACLFRLHVQDMARLLS